MAVSSSPHSESVITGQTRSSRISRSLENSYSEPRGECNISRFDTVGVKPLDSTSYADAYSHYLINRLDEDTSSEEESLNSKNDNCSSRRNSNRSRKSSSISPLIITRSSAGTSNESSATFDKLIQTESYEVIQNKTAKPCSNKNADEALRTPSPVTTSGSNNVTSLQSLRKSVNGHQKVYRSTPHPTRTKLIENNNDEEMSSANNIENVDTVTISSSSSEASSPLTSIGVNKLSKLVSPNTLDAELIASSPLERNIPSNCIVSGSEIDENVNDEPNRQSASSDENNEDNNLLNKTRTEKEENIASDIGSTNVFNNTSISEVLDEDVRNTSNANNTYISVVPEEDARDTERKMNRCSVFSDEELVFSDSEEEREYDKHPVFGKLAMRIEGYKELLSSTESIKIKHTRTNLKRKPIDGDHVIPSKRCKPDEHVECLHPNFIFRLYLFLDKISKSRQYKETALKLKEELENNLPCLSLRRHGENHEALCSSSNSSFECNIEDSVPRVLECDATEELPQKHVQNRHKQVKKNLRKSKSVLTNPAQRLETVSRVLDNNNEACATKKISQEHTVSEHTQLNKTSRNSKRLSTKSLASLESLSSGAKNQSRAVFKSPKSRSRKSSVQTKNKTSSFREESESVRRSARFKCPTGYEIKTNEQGEKVLFRKITYSPIMRVLTKKEANEIRRNKLNKSKSSKNIMSNTAILLSQESLLSTHVQDNSFQQRYKKKLYDPNEWLQSKELQNLHVD